MKSTLIAAWRSILAGIFALLFYCIGAAQGYIAMSTQIGGSQQEHTPFFRVVNGETYVFGFSNGSANYPVVNGNSRTGPADFVVTKFGVAGNIIYSTYLGGSGEQLTPGIQNAMEVVNGEVYILGLATGTGYPSTNGSVYRGGQDHVVTKLNASGGIAYSTYIGGSLNETQAALKVVNGEAYIFGHTNSNNYPVTNGSTFSGGQDLTLTKLSTSGNIAYSTYIGGTNNDLSRAMEITNGEIVLSSRVSSTDFPVTNGSTYQGGVSDIVITKLNLSGTILFSSYFGGSGTELTAGLKVDNGNIYFAGTTSSPNYPSTNGSYFSGGIFTDLFVTKLNSNGSMAYSGYLGGAGQESMPVGQNNLRVVNDELYLIGASTSPTYPVTNASTQGGSLDIVITKFTTAGNIGFSTFIGGSGSDAPVAFEVANGSIYLTGTSASSNYSVTNSSSLQGTQNWVFTRLTTAGNICYSTFIGGTGTALDAAVNMSIENGSAYLLGNIGVNNFPVTTGTSYAGNGDFGIVKINLCPSFTVTADPVSPASQNVCVNGLVQQINGSTISLPGTSMPTIYRNGVASLQNEIYPNYQWQKADAPAGPWTTIPGATDKNYSPPPTAINQYFRRQALQSPCCGSAVISTSDVAAVLVNANNAPAANAGGAFSTCPGSSITIGGTPAATGGVPPYTYAWDNGAGTSTNPLVNPATSTIYTLSVTDALGCVGIDQAVVTPYSANAGPDASVCGGTPVRIGSLPIAGLPGVTYSWAASPADPSMSCTNCAQPDVTPAVTTMYTLTLTIPKSGGGTCTTNDAVVVTPVAGPATPNFAGADVTICFGGTATLGTPAEPGFSYTWAPGTYLSTTAVAQPNFIPGNISLPVPNPMHYYVTATKGGCSFVDDLSASVIEANAGTDKCGPTIIGTSDRTPDISETYSWTKISGPATFLAPSNTPTTIVSASLGGPSVFQLTVSHNGTICTDQVTISDCGCPSITITPNAPASCPSFSLNSGPVTLNSSIPTPFLSSDYIVTWSPAAGLNTTSGETVTLTDNVPRTYTVTYTSKYDPAVACTQNISVNNPAWALPSFTAQDISTCPGTPVSIGQPSVAGYAYQWQPVAGLNAYNISNPTATTSNNTLYPVVVTDILSGCSIIDSATVTILNTPADAGQNLMVCSNGIVTLGTPAQANTNYAWSPAASPWQNGTDQTFAQPEVLVATNLSFTLTATNTVTGCITTDMVDVVVNNTPVLNAPDITICKGAGSTIGAVALPAVTYSWSPSTGLSCTNCAQPVANPGSTTTYTVNATYPGGCTATDNVVVTVSDPTFSIPDITYCPSAGAFALAPTAPLGMTSYSWSPASQLSNATIANPNTLSPAPASATTYTLTLTNAQGCTASDDVTVIPSVSVPLAGNNRSICLNTTTTLGDASNLAGDGWVIVSGPNTSAAQLSCTACAQPVFTPSATGTYKMTVSRNNAGCVSTGTISVTVTGFSLPAIPSPTTCANACVQIGTTPQFGIAYNWTPAVGLSNSSIANPTACVANNNQLYSLKATDLNGCSATSTVLINVNPSLTPQIAINPLVACLGNMGLSFAPNITPAGGYNYLWTPNDASLNSVYTLNAQVNAMQLGVKNYRLTITDAGTGCSNFADVSLTVNLCSVLPVKLQSFNAQAQEGSSVLTWKASAAKEEALFTIEYSTGGSAFHAIGSVISGATSTYRWVDLHPIQGRNYYRLKITNLQTGTISYSEVRVVDFGKLAGKISVYPNPAVNTLKIAAATTLVNKPVTITLLTIDGKVVLRSYIKSMAAVETLDISRLPAGQYIVHTNTGLEVFNQIVQIIR